MFQMGGERASATVVKAKTKIKMQKEKETETVDEGWPEPPWRHYLTPMYWSQKGRQGS